MILPPKLECPGKSHVQSIPSVKISSDSSLATGNRKPIKTKDKAPQSTQKQEEQITMKFLLNGLTAVLILPSTAAFQPAITHITPTISTTPKTSAARRPNNLTIHRNVPLPSIEGGASPEEVKAAADKMAPPASFYELQIASVRAAEDAIRDGYRLLEIEVSFYVLLFVVFFLGVQTCYVWFYCMHCSVTSTCCCVFISLLKKNIN